MEPFRTRAKATTITLPKQPITVMAKAEFNRTVKLDVTVKSLNQDLLTANSEPA